jgi:hypothetical protein
MLISVTARSGANHAEAVGQARSVNGLHPSSGAGIFEDQGDRPRLAKGKRDRREADGAPATTYFASRIAPR